MIPMDGNCSPNYLGRHGWGRDLTVGRGIAGDGSSQIAGVAVKEREIGESLEREAEMTKKEVSRVFIFNDSDGHYSVANVRRPWCPSEAPSELGVFSCGVPITRSGEFRLGVSEKLRDRRLEGFRWSGISVVAFDLVPDLAFGRVLSSSVSSAPPSRLGSAAGSPWWARERWAVSCPPFQVVLAFSNFLVCGVPLRSFSPNNARSSRSGCALPLMLLSGRVCGCLGDPP
ncbi:hypothetical protein F2Q69_00019452 [Brassica cretica]|uniref:Uncharacterized protein n=1 Tax=Brassica cretica TaxID=69181 RepID=A0A8S9QET5_BRACR|nr:hypothetical protein F2Q69_00019452 [Brassica cretica]